MRAPSWVQVRRKWITGVAHRTISSTAVTASPSKSDCHRAICSGWSVRAWSPWAMALRVVSLPATTSRMKNEAISAGVRLSPSTSAVTRAVVRSSCGSFWRASASSVTSVARSCVAPSSAAMTPGSVWSGTYSASPRPRITLVRSKMKRSWLRGMPIMSTMIRSGSVAATSVTKSPSPRSTMSSRISDAIASTSPFI